MSALLLEATQRGLAARIDTQVIELDQARGLLEERVLNATKTAQALVRVGWPADVDEIPASPRRAVDEIFKSTTISSMAEQLSAPVGREREIEE